MSQMQTSTIGRTTTAAIERDDLSDRAAGIEHALASRRLKIQLPASHADNNAEWYLALDAIGSRILQSPDSSANCSHRVPLATSAAFSSAAMRTP